MKRQIKFRFWNKHEKIMSIQSHVDPVFIKDETSAHALELKADAFEIMHSDLITRAGKKYHKLLNTYGEKGE